MSTTAERDAVIAAMRGEPGRRWSLRDLSRAAGLSRMEAAAAVRALQYQGKIAMDRIVLSPSMAPPAAAPEAEAPRPGGRADRDMPAALEPPSPPAPSLAATVAAEAEAAGARRRMGREPSKPLPIRREGGASAGETAFLALAETPDDVLNALRRRWPGLMQRLVAGAREAGVRPGIYLADAVETGLEAFGLEGAE